jgi:hypothetical protein
MRGEDRYPQLAACTVSRSGLLAASRPGLHSLHCKRCVLRRTFMSSIFMTTLFFGFGGLPQLTVALQNRSVWFKHRGCSLYTATAYSWSMSIAQMPLSVLEAFLFSTITYFFIGYTTGVPPLQRFSEPACTAPTLLHAF